jgi:hypothetical protein
MNGDISVIDTAMQAWRNALAARERMPNLFWMALGAMIGLGIVGALIGSFLPLIATILVSLAQAAAVTPLAIAVHRYVLLGEANDAYLFNPSDPRFQKFFLFAVAFEVLGALPRIIAYPLPGFLSGIVALVLSIAAAVISVRCAILFPAVALDSPGADWRNAMADAKGHSWRIFFTLFCTALPGVIVGAVLGAVFGWSSFLTIVFMAVIAPTIALALVAAEAAAASSLYAAYANQLGKPASAGAPRAAF